MKNAARALVLAALTVLASQALGSCISSFEMDLPAHHPARPEGPSSGGLVVPDPYSVKSTSQPMAPMEEPADGPMGMDEEDEQ